jgi:anti-sigma regulatory factor (Ser/Thr protein kinase)
MAGTVLGTITIRRRAADVAEVRRFVAATLGGHPATDTAVLLASEAVTNSVVHTGSAAITVVVIETPEGLRLEVTDEGADTVPVVCGGPDLRENRRGVLLVRELSVRCGFDVDESGLTFWFEL